MTEADNRNYEIIQKNFDGNEIDLIEREDDIWITAEALGAGLEYKNPRISIMKLYSSHRDEIEEYASVTDSITEAGRRETTVFSEMGAYLLIMFSNQPKAKKFRKWIVKVVKEIRKEGFYLEKPLEVGSSEWIIQTLDAMKAMAVKQQEQESRLKNLEEKDRYIFVIPRTKRKLQDEVHRIAIEYFSGNHAKVWNPLKNHFQVSRYEEFTEEDAQTILNGFMSEYPPKFIQEINNNHQNNEKRGLEALWDSDKEKKKFYESENKEV